MSENEHHKTSAEATIRAIWEKLGVRPSAASRPSGRKVADVDMNEFQDFAEEREWEHRFGQGYGYQCNVFGFVYEVYGDFIRRGVNAGNPLTQNDLKAVDPKLVTQLRKEVSKNGGLPEWLYLPENGVAPKITAEELERREAMRPQDLKLYPKPREKRVSAFMRALRSSEPSI